MDSQPNRGLSYVKNGLKRSLPWLSSLGFVFLCGSGLWYFVAFDVSPHFAKFFMWYASLVAVIVISMTRYNQCHRLLKTTQAMVEQELQRRRIKVVELLSEILRPRVDSCEGMDPVCEMAAKIIKEAHDQRYNEHRYITFYGAASLAVPESEYEEYGTVGGSGQQTPYQQYVGALEAATGDKVRMRRYIKLFTEDEFEKRSSAVQRDYVNWLKNQYNMLSRNPHYILGDIVRAPQWGSNLARIITHYAMLEITGNGEAAIVVTDDHLCDTVRRYARETVIGGNDTKNRPKYYGQTKECDKSVAAFKEYLLKTERAASTRNISDEF